MNIQVPNAPAHHNALVSAHTLTLQDKYYAERRLPAATPAGAEDRTYCFRVEFEHDLHPLSTRTRSTRKSSVITNGSAKALTMDLNNPTEELAHMVRTS